MKINIIMKSRIIKAALAIVVPMVVDFIIKKVTDKLDKNNSPKDNSKPLPSPH